MRKDSFLLSMSYSPASRHSAALMRNATEADASALVHIYNHYIRTTAITFEETEVVAEEMAARIERIRESGLPWLVAEESGDVRAYSYAAKWRDRSAYRFSVETTVYVDPNATGRGLGLQIYRHLLSELKRRGLRVAVAAITVPNDPSVKLHERLGFRKVAQFDAVGFKFDQWIDVGYWQLDLNGFVLP